MKWGFGWELGPFETWDAIGVREVLDVGCRLRGRDGRRDGAAAARPAASPTCCAAGRNRFPRRGRAAGRSRIFRSSSRPRTASASCARTPGASLVDLGDGVLAVEFHSKMNAIGGDTMQMMHAGVKEAAANFAALVVGNDAPELFRRREPDAPAARSAGRQLGRNRPDGPRLPGATAGAAVCRRAGRRRAGRPDARRRVRDRPARRSRAGPPKATSASSKSASG